MRILLSSTAVCVALALTGCATDGSRLIERPDAWRAAMPELDAPTPVPNGSIYQSGQDIRLFENSVARRVGDTLMIRLVENMDASKSITLPFSVPFSNMVKTSAILRYSRGWLLI